jgi:hypothetical protein
MDTETTDNVVLRTENFIVLHEADTLPDALAPFSKSPLVKGAESKDEHSLIIGRFAEQEQFPVCLFSMRQSEVDPQMTMYNLLHTAGLFQCKRNASNTATDVKVHRTLQSVLCDEGCKINHSREPSVTGLTPSTMSSPLCVTRYAMFPVFLITFNDVLMQINVLTSQLSSRLRADKNRFIVFMATPPAAVSTGSDVAE